MNDIQAMRDWWKQEGSLDRMRKSMKDWDKKLSHLDDEMLYYVLMRATSILEHRELKGELE